MSSATVIASGNTATASNLPTNTRGAIFNFNVSAATGQTPTLALSLQWQDPATLAWLTLVTLTTITATGNIQAVVYPGASDAAYSVLPGTYRWAWAVGGSNPSFTFSIGVNYLN